MRCFIVEDERELNKKIEDYLKTKGLEPDMNGYIVVFDNKKDKGIRK